MRNMNLTPRPRDLTMLLNSDRTEPADTGRPEPVNTEKPKTVQTGIPKNRQNEKPKTVQTGIPKNRQNEKPESGEEWVKTSVSLRASTRRRLKTFAAEHDMRIQEVVDSALETYLGLNGGE